MALGHKFRQSPYGGGQSQAGPFGAQYQQDRHSQGMGQMPGRGVGGRSAHTVVKSHDALADGGAVPRNPIRVQTAHRGFGGEIQVQVVAFHPQYRPVKHGVDVVRPAFEGAGVMPAPFEGGQQRAGHHRFAAARRGGGYHTFNHCSSP